MKKVSGVRTEIVVFPPWLKNRKLAPRGFLVSTERRDHLFDCWTDSDVSRRQAELAPLECGKGCLRVRVIPDAASRGRRRRKGTPWHARVVGSDKLEVTAVYDYLLGNGWSPLELKHPRTGRTGRKAGATEQPHAHA